MSEAVPPSDSYPVTDRNRLKVVPKRGRYDRATVHAILDAAMVCHIAYVVDGQPFCKPTTFWREGETLFWHGNPVGRMLKAQKAGLPVCLTVTHLDSLVLGRAGFHHSVDYRSAICFGTARAIDDPEAKGKALGAMIDRYYPGRAAELRPIKEKELKATMIIGMDIEEASAKIRDTGLGDEGVDSDLPIYAARFPIMQVIGAAEPCPRMPDGLPVPSGLAGFMPGRRLDEVLQESHRATFGED